MTEPAVRTRLAALADELVQAQAELTALLDSDGGKSADYVRLSFAVEKLQAEETRLTRELPHVIQRELDRLEVEARSVALEAAAMLKTAQSEMIATLRKSGFTRIAEALLLAIAMQSDKLTDLQNAAIRTAQQADRAGLAALRHRGELPRPA